MMTKNLKTNALLLLALVIGALMALLGLAQFSVTNIARATQEAENELTSAKAMCVIERDSGRVLYSKNEHERLPMASLTKIITAIVAIENNADLDRVIEIPKEATGIEGSTIYLKAGEHLSIRDLLLGLCLEAATTRRWLWRLQQVAVLTRL